MTPYLSQKLSKATPTEPLLDQSRYPYQNLVGHLRYLADSTTPDLSHSIEMLGRYTKFSTERHWLAAMPVLAHIKGTQNVGITYSKSSKMITFGKSDYASCPDTYRSTTGYVISWNNGPISWQSKRQKRVAGSTWEA